MRASNISYLCVVRREIKLDFLCVSLDPAHLQVTVWPYHCIPKWYCTHTPATSLKMSRTQLWHFPPTSNHCACVIQRGCLGSPFSPHVNHAILKVHTMRTAHFRPPNAPELPPSDPQRNPAKSSTFKRGNREKKIKKTTL